ncbi:MAG TPA: recombinase family protein [Clostridia bacterium]|nr:recombinase family protein [Clostridia bacterium]
MKIAAAYIRVSTEDQTEYSPDAQLRAIKDYCAKNDYFLDPEHIYIDEGKSGRKAEKRPAFMSMIAAAKRKPAPFEAILCHKFDRFARNREDSVVYKSLLQKECNVKVISITESIDNDKISLIMESMLEAMAEYYSINLSEEVKKGMTEKARRGEPLTVAPFGYKVENKQLVIIPEEAKIIRKIFTDFINGKPYLQIAKECNAAGIKTHRGNMFENRTIDYIIHNPVYAGYIRWTPTGKVRRNFWHPDSLIIKGQHELIITEQEYAAAQKRADEIKAIYRPYYKPQYNKSHWLVGLLKCCDCAGGMVNNNGYFICKNYCYGKCPTRNSIKAEEIEKIVEEHLKKDMDNPGGLKMMNIKRQERDGIDTSIEMYKQRLNRVKEAYESGIDTLEEYKANKNRILAEINELEKKRKPLIDNQDAERIIPSIKELLEADKEIRGQKARGLIQSITWDKKTRSIAIVYYK